jgi:hypothetical protein
MWFLTVPLPSDTLVKLIDALAYLIDACSHGVLLVVIDRTAIGFL